MPKNPIKNQITLLAVIVIIVLGFIAYGNSLHGKFIWDDEHLVIDNIYIRSFSYLPEVFTRTRGAGFQGEDLAYRPLPTVSYMFDYLLPGAHRPI
jgi:hypothetical protein